MPELVFNHAKTAYHLCTRTDANSLMPAFRGAASALLTCAQNATIHTGFTKALASLPAQSQPTPKPALPSANRVLPAASAASVPLCA